MMKRPFLLVILLALYCNLAVAQKSKVDSLQKAYNKNKQDTTFIKLLQEKSGTVYLVTNADSGMLCARQSLALSRKIHYKWGEVRGLSLIATYLNVGGDLPGSLKTTFEALPMAREINDTRAIMSCYNTLGLTYSTLKDNKKSLDNYYESKNIGEKTHTTDLLIVEYNNIARQYLDMNRIDSALFYTKKDYDFSLKNKMLKNIGYLIRNFGIIQFKKGDFKGAINFYNKSIKSISGVNHYLLSEDYRRIAEAYKPQNMIDSCIDYAKLALGQAKLDKNPDQVMRATTLLTDVFKSKGDFKEAFAYQQIMLDAKESLFSQQKTLQVQNLTFNEEQHRQEIAAAETAYQNRVRFYALVGVLAAFVLIASILLFANQKRKKAYNLLHQQKQEIDLQKAKVEHTLGELKATQTQLIQSEKMASLGELTAGIAHEIQNPLNFVNNFSEVNTELIDEMGQEIDKGNFAEVKTIAVDIKENQRKISQHGKRADFIVKGMLQHSRISTGEKQLTNMNVLADEFLKLSYHGLRAKDKSFNAEMVTRFDENLPKINVVQQDMGRVLLNLFNNAFYAVNQKSKNAGGDYKPTIEITTFFLPLQGVGGLKVRDNGNGIPDAIKDKIMQPFFTTKPTGEGTGLGLSLTYDMVVKGHGGKIDVNTKEGEFTEFVVTLPLN